MAIVLDNAQVVFSTGTASIAFNHTVSGSDTFLMVAYLAGDKSATDEQYAGVGLTELHNGSLGAPSYYYPGCYAMLDPTPGSNDVTMTLSGANDCLIAVASYTGVDSYDTLGGPYDDDGVTSITNNMSSATGDMVVDMIFRNADSSTTQGAGQTRNDEYQVADTFWTGATSEEAGSGTTTMSWSWTGSSRIVQYILNLNAAASGSSLPNSPFGKTFKGPLGGPF